MMMMVKDARKRRMQMVLDRSVQQTLGRSLTSSVNLSALRKLSFFLVLKFQFFMRFLSYPFHIISNRNSHLGHPFRRFTKALPNCFNLKTPVAWCLTIWQCFVGKRCQIAERDSSQPFACQVSEGKKHIRKKAFGEKCKWIL